MIKTVYYGQLDTCPLQGTFACSTCQLYFVSWSMAVVVACSSSDLFFRLSWAFLDTLIFSRRIGIGTYSGKAIAFWGSVWIGNFLSWILDGPDCPIWSSFEIWNGMLLVPHTKSSIGPFRILQCSCTKVLLSLQSEIFYRHIIHLRVGTQCGSLQWCG